MSTIETPPAARTAFWNDPVKRGLALQSALVAFVVLVVWAAWTNMSANMVARGLTFGWDYLSRPANFAIGEGLIPFAPTDSYGRALAVGLLNTLRIAVVGIVLATLLGVAIGVMRLSSNPLLARLVAGYVEVVRNTPLLLQLFLWYAIINTLPGPRQALPFGPGMYLSNRGMKVPWVEWSHVLWPVVWAFVAGVVAAVIAARALKRRREATGDAPPTLPIAVSLMVVPPFLALAVQGFPATISVPVLQGFNFTGGIELSPEFVALLLGLVLYTAAFIAEIVRGGIVAVSKGQWEAARALGLPAPRIMRLVILPQALRVIIPPLTSQYLNLTKNSSLAVAIGYPDLVHVSNTTMNQTGRAVEVILVFALVYLTISLLTSGFMNWYNGRVAIRER
ncbi:MAG: amino acid ABC transporter permease [Phreatobacter sp.]|uniref:amino acid ABC transporter permease n=1 Tax=Phreatobacter sp. TaxID=1966341 RepID=UPI00403814CC